MTRLIPKRLGAPYGGLNKVLAETQLPDNVFTRSDNFVMRNKCLTTANGWLKLTPQVLEEGDVAGSILTSLRIEQFPQASGSNDLLVFTNKRAYRFDESLQLWIPITEGLAPVITNLTSLVNPGDVTINHAFTLGFTNGEQVLLGFGTSTIEYLIISNVTPISFDVTRPTWAPAGIGAQFAHGSGDEVRGLAAMTYLNTDQVDTAVNADIFYFTDGINPVQQYPAQAVFHTNQPGLQPGDGVQGIGVLTTPLLAKNIRIVLGFMVLAHLTEEGILFPNKFRWSQIDNFIKWENELDGSGQAGAFLFSGPDFIIRMEILKRELMFYRDTSIEAVSYVGLPDIFTLRRTETSTGLASFKGLVNRVDRHIFVGTDNIYQTDGLSFTPIGSPIRDVFYNDVDPTSFPTTEMFYLETFNEIWLSYSINIDRKQIEAYVFDMDFQVWAGPRKVDATAYGAYRKTNDLEWDAAPGTWDTRGSWYWNQRLFAATFPLALMGNDLGLIFVLETDPLADGVAFTKRYESKRTDCDRPDLLKSVQRIRIGADPTVQANLNIWLGVAFSEVDTIAWKGPFAMALGPDYEPYVYMDEYGRFFKVRIQTQGTTVLQDVEIAYYYRESI